MAFVTVAEARAAAQRAIRARGLQASAILREARDSQKSSFDVFLSHSRMDSELVLGAKQILEEAGLTVYVDWIDDPQLDRSSVNRQTAEQIRVRMRQCNRLFYLHSKNSANSSWCPWELGYFDAKSHPHRAVYVFPLVETSGEAYVGQEYLSLYDTVDIANIPRAVPSNVRHGVDPFGLRPFMTRGGGYIL